MKFGIMLGNVGHLPLREGVERLAVTAEELGLDSVWVSDHVVFPKDYALDEDHKLVDALATGQHGDPLISLAYVAGKTKRVKIGTSVIALPLRNPLVAAKMISTLDVLSGGRVILGVGLGWLQTEFTALQAPPFSARGKVADEWISIMRSCWSEEYPAFKGEHYMFSPIYFSPKPVKSIPIWVGGNSEAALRRAGRLADGWFGSRVAIGEIPASIRKVKQAAEAAGRDPTKLSFALAIEIDIVDEGMTRSTTGLISPERALTGTSEVIAERIQSLDAAGIHHLELRFRPLRDVNITSIEPTLSMLQRFATEVIPRLKR